MDPSFQIDEDDRSGSLPSVEEVRMNVEAARRQSNASLGKSSDIETAYSGSVDAGDHDQLPSVHDLHMDAPRRGGSSRCKLFLLVACVVAAVVIVTVALVVTQAGTPDDDFNKMQGESYENGDFPANTLPPPSTPEVMTPEVMTPAATNPPQQDEEASTPETATTVSPLGRYGEILQILAQRGVTPMSSLIVQGSPQQQAADWLAEKDIRAVPLDQIDTIVQRYVLAVFFYTMGGPDWTNSLNFLSKEDICKWYIAGFAGDNKELKQFGVTCNDQGTVKAIHFPSNFLAGSFPIELSQLKDLERFDVFNNGRITGGFPAFFNGLPKISFIGLHYCGLQGQLPTWLGGLTSLKSLVLSNNQFTGTLPASMSELNNLEDLYLDDNQFTGGITALVGLSKLENLVIEDNQFEGALDDTMASGWPQLKVFDASHNKLKSNIPASIFTLSNLRVLDLHENELYGPLPKIPGTHPSLQILTLNVNSLDGEIPSEISSFVNLQTLDLSGNSFISDIPASIGTMSKLQYLFLSQNNFNAGPIPNFLSNLVSLKQLSLKDTMRNGPIPSWIGNLNQLLLLDLDMNSLSGPIPPSLGNLNNLEYLLLNRNELEGTIPATLSSLANLKFFMIDQNKLSGSADAVCKYPDNVEMFVADCQVTSTSPEVDCPCCNVCCSDGNEQCNDKVWLGDSNPIWELGFERAGIELDAEASRSYTVQFAGAIP